MRRRRAILAKRHTEEAERCVEEVERHTEEPKHRADLTDRSGGDTLTKALATAIKHEENKLHMDQIILYVISGGSLPAIIYKLHDLSLGAIGGASSLWRRVQSLVWQTKNIYYYLIRVREGAIAPSSHLMR
jgi:hypothetical protein